MNEDDSHISQAARAFADTIEAAAYYYFTLYEQMQHA